jgi:GT2 family glycosyltransferase
VSPDLSIIIVSWNVSELLGACLSSLQLPGQDPSSEHSDTHPLDVEIIVVDNASADGTVDMVRTRFPHVRLIANNQNRGFAGGNNQGIAAAQGRYLLLLNPDTKVLNDAVLSLVGCLDGHPDVGLVGPQLLFPDGQVQSSRRRFPTVPTLFFESTWLESVAPAGILEHYYILDRSDQAVLDVDWVVGAAMVVRRSVFEQVGGLDEGFFMYSEEMDWCRRIKAAGWRVVYCPRARVVHYEGKSSEQTVPARHINFQRSKIRYARKYHGAMVATILRLYLLALFGWQLGLELTKGILGHRRALRWQRVRAYGQVLRSGL